MNPAPTSTAAAGDPILRWIAAGLYAAAIFLQSSFPATLDAPALPGADKLLHAAAYGLLAVLLARALVAWPGGGRPRRTIALAAFFLAVLYGASDEFHQALVPARTADGWDWLADAAGAALGAAVWRHYAARTRA